MRVQLITLFQCDAKHHRRRLLQYTIGEKDSLDTIVDAMLKSSDNLNAVKEFFRLVIIEKISVSEDSNLPLKAWSQDLCW